MNQSREVPHSRNNENSSHAHEVDDVMLVVEPDENAEENQGEMGTGEGNLVETLQREGPENENADTVLQPDQVTNKKLVTVIQNSAD